ncbi:IclR family transcriptional regulator [Bacillus canaveralius]|nr:IclR family transcriptional regulator [Bacillus canaveralius]
MGGNTDFQLSSVNNALRLLHCFSIDEPEKKVTELASTLGLAKSTVSRLLSTLANQGFVSKDLETQKYRLGLSILQLNTVITSNLKISRESQQILQNLVNEVGETAHTAALDGSNVVYLSRVECKHPVQILSHVGRRNPLHCTSSGKVILAHQDEMFIENYLENGLSKFTKNTITDPLEFREALRKIKQQGHAVSIEEFNEGVTSIAAPVRDFSGRTIYAVCVIGPVHRFDVHNQSLIYNVTSAAEEISKNLGYLNYIGR